MRHRIVRTLVAFVAASAVAGGGAAYAAGTHHRAHPREAPRNYPVAGATGMSGSTGSHHCPGM
jgi:hypothetical protein